MGKSKLVTVCLAGSFLGLFTEGPRRKQSEKYGPHCCRAVSAGSKPPAAVGVRISTGEKHGFGAAAPFVYEGIFP